MTHPPLRLVFDNGEYVPPVAIELPSPRGDGLQIHLHFGLSARPEPLAASTPAPPAVAQGQPERSWRRSLVLGAASLVIALVAYDLGARWGEGHTRAVETSPRPWAPPPFPNQLPTSLRQQLAQPPTVTPPPDIRAPNAADPFGFQR